MTATIPRQRVTHIFGSISSLEKIKYRPATKRKMNPTSWRGANCPMVESVGIETAGLSRFIGIVIILIVVGYCAEFVFVFFINNIF